MTDSRVGDGWECVGSSMDALLCHAESVTRNGFRVYCSGSPQGGYCDAYGGWWAKASANWIALDTDDSVQSGYGIMPTGYAGSNVGSLCSTVWHADLKFQTPFNSASHVLVSPEHVSAQGGCVGGSTDAVICYPSIVTMSGFRLSCGGSPAWSACGDYGGRRGGRKRALGTRAPMTLPQGPNQRWSLDFLSDAFADGRRFRILAIVDDFTRECLALMPDTSLPGLLVVRELNTLTASRGRPLMCVSDNGTELTGMAILRWSQEARVEWHYIAPGKPQQNAFIESFNGRLRDELLNETLFTSLSHVREALAIWMEDYNTVRPYSALGNLPPATYAKLSAPTKQRDGALRYVEGSAPRPVASPSHQRSNEERTLLISG